MSIWRVIRDTLIAVGLALVVALLFNALARFGGKPATDAYLHVGYVLSNLLPESLVSWLDAFPEVSQGRVAASILSFFVWWFALMAITFGARTYVRARP